MPHEAIVDVIGAVLEVGLDTAVGSDKKKSGFGCFLITIILCLLIGGLYYLSTEKSNHTHGLVTKKISNDKIIVKTKNGEDVYTITHELYLNKKVGDSIILNK